MPKAPKKDIKNVRRTALGLLLRCERDRVYSNLILDTAIRREALSEADRGLLTALFCGVLETRLTLDYLIEHLSSRPVQEIDEQTLVLLRMGLYQLRYLDRIPPHAAIYETVELATGRARPFVNAVLRSYTREKDTIALPDPQKEPLRYLSVRYSFPEGLCARFVDIFGKERTERIFSLANEAPPLTLRVNTRKTTVETLAARLAAAGFEVEKGLHAPYALRLKGGNPAALPGFDEGEFFVQDEASQICVEAMGLSSSSAKAPRRVLDICACPGSKTFGLALSLNAEDEVTAFDLHPNKLSLIQKGAARLGLDSITTAARDGRDFDPALQECADAVLCDVPCSGFGVLAKKTEIRYKDLSDVSRLADIQLAILENACRYVRSGGVLIYSTCKVYKGINEYAIYQQ